MNIGCCIATKDIPLAQEFGYDYVELSAKEIMKMDTELWKLKRKEICIRVFRYWASVLLQMSRRP